MTINEVYVYYGENWAESMRRMGLARMSYRYWMRIGGIPRQTQYKIQKLTDGELKVTPHVD